MCINCGTPSNIPCNCNCPPGEPGAPGPGYAFVITVEPAGINCAFGGYKLQGGADANWDGVPESFIGGPRYICNGAPSLQQAIKLTGEPSGPNCTNGGIKIETGTDSNNDGIPDTAITTKYICNGSSGSLGTTPTFVTGATTSVPFGTPASITVVSLGGAAYRVDFQIPDGAPGPAGPAATTTTVTLNGLLIPTCAISALGGATNLTQVINYLLTSICNITGSTMNGSPGQFSVNVNNPQILQTPLVRSYISLLKDSTDGYFDNGGVHDGVKHIIPTGGSIARLQITDIEVEYIRIPIGINQNLTFEILEIDVTGAVVGAALGSVSVALSTAATIGNKIYMTPLTIASPGTPYAAGKRYVASVVATSAAGTDAIIAINSLNFNNIV